MGTSGHVEDDVTNSNGAQKRGSKETTGVRTADRWLIGLVLFLIALVIVGAGVGFTALSRQSRATCYQLNAIEATRVAELALAKTDGPENRATHLARAEASRVYATGLRAIVPGCPTPPKIPLKR